MKKPTIESLTTSLNDSYRRWKTIYHEGSSDPSWEDGTNLSLVRSHIFYYKNPIEETLGDRYAFYPDAFYYPEPFRVAYNLMTIDRKVHGEMKTCNKSLPYEEMIKFDWDEVL